MSLQQRRYPFGSVTYSLYGTALIGEEKRLLGSRISAVSLHYIGSRIPKARQSALSWCIIAPLATAVALGTLGGVFGDAVGMLACGLMSSVFSAMTWHGFFARKIPLVILHSGDTGDELVFLYRPRSSLWQHRIDDRFLSSLGCKQNIL